MESNNGGNNRRESQQCFLVELQSYIHPSLAAEEPVDGKVVGSVFARLRKHEGGRRGTPALKQIFQGTIPVQGRNAYGQTMIGRYMNDQMVRHVAKYVLSATPWYCGANFDLPAASGSPWNESHAKILASNE